MARLKRGFGLLKRKPDGKPFNEEWAEHKREERELETAAAVLDAHTLLAFFRGAGEGKESRTRHRRPEFKALEKESKSIG